jgi:hypothetical protein
MKWRLKGQYKETVKQSWFFKNVNKIEKPLAKLTIRKQTANLIK